MFARLTASLRALVRRRTIDLEANEELQFHIERETAANVARGMPAGEARRIALAELGGVVQTTESVREVRSLGLGSIALDVRYGLKSLLAAPRFTIVALLTMVLMIAGITTIFTLVHGVLLRPLPYPHSDRLLVIESHQPKKFGTNVALLDAQAFQAASSSFDAWGLYRPGYVTTTRDAQNVPVDLQDQQITPDLLRMLEIDVVLGRPLLPSDTDASAPAVALISHDLWQTLYGGRPDVLNTTIKTFRESFTIVGVTEPGVKVPRNWLDAPILWRPIRSSTPPTTGFSIIARLREDVPLSRAQAELDVVATRLEAEQPASHAGRTAGAIPLLDKVVGDYKQVLWIFFGAIGFVLLIGVANLISLQIARNGSREREISVRAALGATRGRIIRQLVTESLLLGLAGAAIGFAIAVPAVTLILSTLPVGFPRVDQVAVNWVIAFFALGVSLVCSVVVGLVPAWQAARADLAPRLTEGGRSATLSERRARVQRTLIVVETAAALILLIGAGLMANSFQRLISRDAGMLEDGLWVVRGSLPNRYATKEEQLAFWTMALEQVRQLPGVQSAGLEVNSSGPLSGGDISSGGIVVEGQVRTSPRDGASLSRREVSADYFATLGMRLVKGRPILASDTTGAEPVAVLNELAAKTLWPGQDPIGRRFLPGDQPITVVGVIPTYLHSRLAADPSPQMYLSYLQRASFASTSVIVIRTTPGSSGVAAAAMTLLRGLEKDLEVRAQTMAQNRWALLATERFRTAVLLTFAVTAVFLALLGIFGLVSYTVGQRQREIAIRVALGAVPGHVIRIASRHALVPAFAGLALGVAGAVATTRLLSSYLVDIKPLDVPTFTGAMAVLALAAMVAGVIPARRALRIEPVEALRHE